MTAQLSTGNTGFRTYLFYRLTQMKRRFIAICLMSLFSYPLIAAAIDLNAYAELEERIGARPQETVADLWARVTTINTVAGILATAGIILLLVLFLQGLFTAKDSMRRLWNRKYTDMDMSLPVSADTRFFGDIISGFGTYIIPQIIAALLSLLVLLPADGFAEQFRLLAASTVNSSDAGNITAFFRDTMPYLLYANVMMYFFCLMILAFCGRRLTANVVPFVFLLGTPALIFFLSVIAGENCYGVGMGELVYGPLWDCTPVGMILSSYTLYPSQYAGLYHSLPWLRAILYSLVFGAAAYFMIKYRREERAGSAFVYKAGRYATEIMIMLTSAAVIRFVMLENDGTGGQIYGIARLVSGILNVPDSVLITTWVIVNIIVFAVIELVSREKLRKPKKLGLAVARFAAGAALSFLVCIGFEHCDGFGAASYVPDVSDINSIGLMTYGADMAYIDKYAELESDDAKRMITDLHRRIIAERPDPPGYDDVGYQILNISYDLKDGSGVSRSYALPPRYTHDCMKLWFESGAFAESYNDRMPADVDIERLSVKVSYYDEVTGGSAKKDTDIDTNEFLSALKRDIAKTTYEDIFSHDGCDLIYVYLMPKGSLTSLYYFVVWDTFEETRALLRAHNCDIFGQDPDRAVKYYMFRATSKGNYQPGIGDPAEQREYREPDRATAKELLSKSAVMTAYPESRDIYIIIPIYEFSDDNGNTAYIPGTQYYVTEPNLGEAAEVYANAPAVSEEDAEKYAREYIMGRK
jgi:hypothetical protein